MSTIYTLYAASALYVATAAVCCYLQVARLSPEEQALFDADSLYEQDWKKIVVDSNAVMLMSGTHISDQDNHLN